MAKDKEFEGHLGRGSVAQEQTALDLYTCYVEYMETVLRIMAPKRNGQARQDRFREVNRVQTREEFEASLRLLDADPVRRQQYEKLLRAGFSEYPSPEEKRSPTEMLPEEED